MQFSPHRAGRDDDGRRLDRIVRKVMPSRNLSDIYSLIRKGFIRLNGAKTKQNATVHEGDVLEFAEFLHDDFTAVSAYTEAHAPFDVLFENRFVKIIDKPYDMPVQPSASRDNNTGDHCVCDYIGNNVAPSLSFVPAPLHRLDRKTTGILVCSQSLDGARIFSQMLREHKIKKCYLALVEGIIEKPVTWVDFIETLPEEESLPQKASFSGTPFRRVSVQAAESNAGKRAETSAVSLASGTYNGKAVSLVSFQIATGRHHQIRAQSAKHGFPLVGDSAYGASITLAKNAEQAADNKSREFFLHAYQMRFPHENSLEIPELITSPLSSFFEEMLAKCLIAYNISQYNEL